MNTYSEEEQYNGDIKFHLSYLSNYKPYRTDLTILVDYSYVDRMRELLDDFGFSKEEEE